MTDLVVVGASGFGREVLDVVEAINQLEHRFAVLGVLDDAPSAMNMQRLHDRGCRYLGTSEAWRPGSPDVEYVVGIGDPAVRRRLARGLQRRGLRASVLIHPGANVGSRFTAGPGSVVCAGAIVSTNVRLGSHVHVNPGVTIGHDAQLEDFVSVNPGAVISGECVIEAGSLIGAGAVVLQNRRVGAGSVVGAAACVVHDVPPATVARGVPARFYPQREGE